jgi:hypothetical protein
LPDPRVSNQDMYIVFLVKRKYQQFWIFPRELFSNITHTFFNILTISRAYIDTSIVVGGISADKAIARQAKKINTSTSNLLQGLKMIARDFPHRTHGKSHHTTKMFPIFNSDVACNPSNTHTHMFHHEA